MLLECDSRGSITDAGVQGKRKAPGLEERSFYCTGQVWYDMLDLARKHGWRPAGTIPAEEAREAWAREARPDVGFEPRLRPYVKQVRAEDAVALANALERALADPVEMAMLRIRLDSARHEVFDGLMTRTPRPLSSELLRDFIAFVRKGPFVFAWCDF
jgi:hypothetical protein